MSKKQSRFGSNVVANVEKRQQERSGFGYLNLPKNVSMFKVDAEGKIRLDIIPYIVSDPHHLDRDPDNKDAANVGNPWYKKPIWVHGSVGADKQSVLCPAKMIGKKCPICEARESQRAEGMEKDDMIQYPRQRNLYVVIPIGNKKFEEKYHIWDAANGNFQKELDEELKENPEMGSFPDPEEGKTLLIRFTEEKFNKNKFYAAGRIDFEDREEAYEESVMDKAPKLDDIVKILSYKELETMFLELGDEAEEEDRPKKKKPVDEEEDALPRKRRPVDDVDDDKPKKRKEEDDDDVPFDSPRLRKKASKPEPEEEEEEEEEVKPKRKSAPVETEEEEEEKPKRKRPVMDDDEEGEKPKGKVRSEGPKDDDDEEEEKPIRRRASKPEPEEEEDEDKPQKKRR